MNKQLLNYLIIIFLLFLGIEPATASVECPITETIEKVTGSVYVNKTTVCKKVFDWDRSGLGNPRIVSVESKLYWEMGFFGTVLMQVDSFEIRYLRGFAFIYKNGTRLNHSRCFYYTCQVDLLVDLMAQLKLNQLVRNDQTHHVFLNSDNWDDKQNIIAQYIGPAGGPGGRYYLEDDFSIFDGEGLDLKFTLQSATGNQFVSTLFHAHQTSTDNRLQNGLAARVDFNINGTTRIGLYGLYRNGFALAPLDVDEFAFRPNLGEDYRLLIKGSKDGKSSYIYLLGENRDIIKVKRVNLPLLQIQSGNVGIAINSPEIELQSLSKVEYLN